MGNFLGGYKYKGTEFVEIDDHDRTDIETYPIHDGLHAIEEIWRYKNHMVLICRTHPYLSKHYDIARPMGRAITINDSEIYERLTSTDLGPKSPVIVKTSSGINMVENAALHSEIITASEKVLADFRRFADLGKQYNLHDVRIERMFYSNGMVFGNGLLDELDRMLRNSPIRVNMSHNSRPNKGYADDPYGKPC